ncbi:MAG: prepilin-type N-terminal cleavage/methylation domain-containing protein [bacterium]|nr:prepilin-type N-terminal cleavage/methylation domain-containing protein [bacterium]
MHIIKQSFRRFHRGFTLIELLVVIAVIGLLAGAVIAIIDPIEQLAAGRDASRKAKVSQLGKAVEAYAVDNAQYPLEGVTWMTTLSARGYIKAIIPAVSGNKACGSEPAQNNFCYGNVSPNAYVFTYVESKKEASKCTGGVGGSGSGANVYYVYDTTKGTSCLKCGSGYLTGVACNTTQ